MLAGRSFMSAMCVALDPKSGQASVVGAGHPPLLVTRFGRGTEAIAASAPPLGLVEESSFIETALELNPGDASALAANGLIIPASWVGVDRGRPFLAAPNNPSV